MSPAGLAGVLADPTRGILGDHGEPPGLDDEVDHYAPQPPALAIARRWAAASIAATSMLGADAARGADDALLASQRQVAGIVTIAKTAPILRPWIEADDDAIRLLMGHVQITDADIMGPDRFGPDDEAIARSFALSVKEDAGFYAKMFVYLGDRSRLLRRKPGG